MNRKINSYQSTLDRPVFISSLIVLMISSIPLFLFPDWSGIQLSAFKKYIDAHFGIAYQWLSIIVLIVSFWIAFSKYGKINLSKIDADNAVTFHAASVGSITYNDSADAGTFGATTATLESDGTYTGSVDDSYVMIITGSPNISDSAKIFGATFEVIRNNLSSRASKYLA